MNAWKRILSIFWLIPASAPAQQSPLPDQMLPPEFVLPNSAAIGLSAAQSQALTQGITKLQAQMRPLQAQMYQAEADLTRLLVAAKPDDAAVLAKYADLDALESEVKQLRLRMTLLAKSVMTPEQHAKALSLKAARPTVPGDGRWLRERLERVRDGIARWEREGRDVSRVTELWQEFQSYSQKHWFQKADQALEEALALLEANP
jgi:Spy/CpxP family protein refolding chaperone